ncbi:MAG: GNAT family N-acetyltransferase [Gemmatimonadales bacterium]
MIRPATGPVDLAMVRDLFQEYAASLGFNLHFQKFDQELADLPGGYGPPGGTLLLAMMDGIPGGCVGVRPLEGKICEMKRLYVRPTAREVGLGRALAEAAIGFGAAAGYRHMRLDTLPTMQQARTLYESLGFKPIPPYRYNPIPDTLYLERSLTTSRS